MAVRKIFRTIWSTEDPDSLFELLYDFFSGQGFSAVVYSSPASVSGPLRIMHRGFPEVSIAAYEAEARREVDPVPTILSRLARPALVSEVRQMVDSLSQEEREFLQRTETSIVGEGLLFPLYGPFGRIAFVGVFLPVDPVLFGEIDRAFSLAVAQLFHSQFVRVETGEVDALVSPRERSVLQWMAKGKSSADIATILGIAPGTVNTHTRRLYEKLGVNDRMTCVSKARALHIL